MNITVEDLIGQPRADGFYSLFALRSCHPVGAIADAIEQHGVHTVDRFGRLRAVKQGKPEALAALDALADVLSCETTLQLLEEDPGEHALTRAAAYARALYVARCNLTAAHDRLAAYGWPQANLPDLGTPAPQQVRRPGDQTKIENTLARVVAVLAAAHGIDVTRRGAAQELHKFFIDHGQRPPAVGTLQNVVAGAIGAVDKFEIILPDE